MATQNEITTLTFTKESDNWWHSRFTMDTDDVIVQIDSKTEREKYTLVVVYSGTEEYGTTYYNQSFALYGNSSRVFNIKGIEGLNIDIQTNIKPDFGGVMGSVTEVDPPTPPTPPDPPTPPTPPTPTEDPDYLCFTANKAGATLRMTGMYSEDYTGDDFALEYSTDGETWQDWNITKNDTGIGMGSAETDTLTFTSIGDKVYLRGDNAYGTGSLTILLGNAGYLFTFAGGEGTQPNDNVFAVTGDLQTLKDKTGQDKVAAEFAQLFHDLSGEEPTILITSAPDLTATTLIDNCYAGIFSGQILLTFPAAMPLLTFTDLSANNTEMEVSGCFAMMYAGSGISTPANFNNVEISGTLSQDEARKVFNFYYMYYGVSETNSNFVITNDNGASLIGFDGIEFPIVFVDSPYDVHDFANDILGIEAGAGFDTVYLYSEPNDSSYGSAHFNHIGSDHGSLWLPTNGSVEIEVVAYSYTGYQFVKWQSSSDGETWTDIPGATSDTYTATLTQAGDYYYKAVFEPLVTIRIDNSQSGQNIVIEYSDSQAAVQDGWAGNRYYKTGEVLSFRPASIDDGGTTKYLAINGVVGTSYTVTTDTTLVITFE